MRFVKGKSYLATVDNKVDLKASYSLMRVIGEKALFRVVPICKAARSTIICADLHDSSFHTIATVNGMSINSSLEMI